MHDFSKLSKKHAQKNSAERIPNTLNVFVNTSNSGTVKPEVNDLVSVVKKVKILLEEDTKVQISQYRQNRITIQNVCTFYKVAKLFNMSNFAGTAFKFIERCFDTVVQSQTFLELDFTLVAKIFSSSCLNITSEVQIFNAADKWIRYNKKERSEFAKNLLLKVRLTLLSDGDLAYLTHKPSAFTENDDCATLLKQVSNSKENFDEQKSCISLQHRYCNQNGFNLLICGGRDIHLRSTVRSVSHLEICNLNKVYFKTQMKEERIFASAVCFQGEIYMFGGYNKNSHWLTSIEKYSPATKTWNQITNMYDARKHFCVCAFMNGMFVIGGQKNGSTPILDSCLEFDTKSYKWKSGGRMNQARYHAVCTVFEERIVVSGGVDINNFVANTVESYNVISKTWSPMPNMINGRSHHSMLVVKHKLFALGSSNNTCEVFDSTSNQFSDLKPPRILRHGFSQCISDANSIIVFQGNLSLAFRFDVDKNDWSDVEFGVTDNLVSFCAVKIPYY